MSPFPSLPRRRSARLVAGTAVLAVAAGLLGATAPALAATPASPVQIFLESNNTSSVTLDPTNAITSGWWGHEGAGRSGSSLFSMDGTGGLNAQLAKIGPDANAGNLGVAFVLTSADGSAEQPTMTADEPVGDVFQWFDASTMSSALAGSTSQSDYVDALSTQSSYTSWENAGAPVYGFDNNLQATDSTSTCQVGTSGCGTNGAPLSGPHAIGTSILNTWAAGTHVSLVYYVMNGTTANGEPIVKKGADGKAETAWMPFTTVALPTDHTRDPVGTSFPASYDTLRTSAGYVVNGASVAPTVHLTTTWKNGVATLNASLTDASGHALAPVPTGTIQFLDRPVNSAGGAFTADGAAMTVSATGTASMPVTGLSSGETQEFEATYTPDAASSSAYASATSGIDEVIAPAATSTKLAVSGTLKVGYKQTLSATVTSTGGTPTGSVTFLDKGATLGTVTLSSGRASLSKALSLGTHSISVKYNGSSAFGSSASAAKSVVIAKGTPAITQTLSPVAARLVHGSRPKLTVTVKATGLTVTGSLTIVVLAPNRKTTTLHAKLSRGKATVTLPAVRKGKTKLTIKYSGSSSVSAGSKVYSFTVSR